MRWRPLAPGRTLRWDTLVLTAGLLAFVVGTVGCSHGASSGKATSPRRHRNRRRPCRRHRRRAPSVSPQPASPPASTSPLMSTEEEYFQACHAAKLWMAGPAQDRRVAARALPGDGSDVAVAYRGQLEHPVGRPDPGAAGGGHHRRARRRQRRMRVRAGSGAGAQLRSRVHESADPADEGASGRAK